ncbi:cell division ATP-binding protein FtsE [Collinsella ureilytica]
MGNHFRTSGDEQPVPAEPAMGESPLHPETDHTTSSTPPEAAHEFTSAHAAAIPDPALPPQVPDPLEASLSTDPALAERGPLTAANFRTSEGPAVVGTDVEGMRQMADVNAAIASPDFTTVFSPLDSADAELSDRVAPRDPGVEPVILMEHLTKVYAAQPNKPALDDINLAIYPGEFVFLVGHSGSGKTTLLNTILRNVKPSSGKVLVAGQDLMRIKNRRIPFLRRQIGAVFQDYKLLPNKTAYENVAFALQCIGKPRGVIRAQVPEVLRLVGLGEQMDSLPDQLSGGEQQRVSVARAMVNRPPLLICDEPTGNLDPAISLGIMKLLERINRTGTTVIVATHDREMVDSMHRRVIALEGGRVIRDQERGGYGNYGTL